MHLNVFSWKLQNVWVSFSFVSFAKSKQFLCHVSCKFLLMPKFHCAMHLVNENFRNPFIFTDLNLQPSHGFWGFEQRSFFCWKCSEFMWLTPLSVKFLVPVRRPFGGISFQEIVAPRNGGHQPQKDGWRPFHVKGRFQLLYPCRVLRRDCLDPPDEGELLLPRSSGDRILDGSFRCCPQTVPRYSVEGSLAIFKY